MSTGTLSLYQNTTKLVDLTIQLHEPTENEVLRNSDAVQPPASNRQAAFGDGVHRAGLFTRMAAMCDVDSYASVYHAQAALEGALLVTNWLRFEGWQLPIAAPLGLVERQLFVPDGFKARLRLIPASPYWRGVTSVKSGTGSQAAKAVTGSGFASGDVGRLVVFASGAEALITSFSSSSSVGTDVDQTVGSGSYAVHDAATGLL